MSGLALISSQYYIYTSYCTPNSNVRVDNGELHLFSIYFSLLISFLFIFILETRVRNWYDLVSHISHSHTVTQSCVMMKNSKRFQKDNIIQYVLYILILRQIYIEISIKFSYVNPIQGSFDLYKVFLTNPKILSL